MNGIKGESYDPGRNRTAKVPAKWVGICLVAPHLRAGFVHALQVKLFHECARASAESNSSTVGSALKYLGPGSPVLKEGAKPEDTMRSEKCPPSEV